MKKFKKYSITFFFSVPILYYYVQGTVFARNIAKTAQPITEALENIGAPSIGILEKIMSLFTIGNFEHILAIIGVFATLATLTANKTDNKICDMILKVINAIGMNFGLSQNKDDEKAIK